MRRLLTPLLAGLLVGLLLGGCNDPKKNAADHPRDTAKLQTILPLLETDRVTYLRSQDWCRVIDYRRGLFGSSTEGHPPVPGRTPPAAFDPAAQADLDRIWQAVETTDTGVYMISEVRFDESGRFLYGEFDCGAGFVSQHYVYDPGHTVPADLPHERWHTAIDANWYYVQEDWN